MTIDLAIELIFRLSQVLVILVIMIRDYDSENWFSLWVWTSDLWIIHKFSEQSHAMD
jgi:hypothetical protein